MPKREIEITPDTLLMKHLGSSGHTLGKAICELVDNSIDSFLEHRGELKKIGQKRVTVTVEMGRYQGEEYIVVSDDAFGMSARELTEAMVLARAPKAGLKGKGKALIGRFGMGMKTACSSLGKVFDITSSQPGEQQTHLVHYDEDTFINQRNWKIHIEAKAKEKKRAHGTRVRIQSLKKKLQSKRYLGEKLGTAFGYYIAKGLLVLDVQGVRVAPSSRELLTRGNLSDLTRAKKARERWEPAQLKRIAEKMNAVDFDKTGRKNFEFKLAGLRVTGWVGILKESSQRGRYGFSLFRHDRVVREFEKVGFAEHPATARVTGELHLDEWDVTYNKDEFVRDTDEWLQLTHPDTGVLREYISDVVAISRRLAVKPQKTSIEEQNTAETEGRRIGRLTKDAEFLAGLDEEIVEESLRGIAKSKSKTAKPITPTEAKEAVKKAKESIKVIRHVRHELVEEGPKATYVSWDTEHDGKERALVVRTNTDHPFYAALPESGRKWYYAFLVAECYAEYIQREVGYQSVGLVKNLILAQQGSALLNSVKAGSSEFKASLVEPK